MSEQKFIGDVEKLLGHINEHLLESPILSHISEYDGCLRLRLGNKEIVLDYNLEYMFGTEFLSEPEFSRVINKSSPKQGSK